MTTLSIHVILNVIFTGGEFNVAGRDIYKIYNYLSTDEQRKLQDWLAAPDSSINYSTALNKKVAGTGQWILEDSQYLKWKKKGNNLWIQGQAGSGKTFLIIIENVKTASLKSMMGYHYFDICDNSGMKTSFQGLLLSLVVQLDECKEENEVFSFCMKMTSLPLVGNNHKVDDDIATFIDMQLSFESTNLNNEVKRKLIAKADGGITDSVTLTVNFRH
ncbi:hypothetical protein EV360DRAFT_75453 [Lentinula raphanica]|nr:hypothetical protein EV360DRAFT_75453 [Lentinula raphanica]